MQSLQNFWATPAGSAVRNFLTVFIGLAVEEFYRVGHFDFTNLEAWVIKALASLVLGVSATASRIANPADELSL